MAVIIGSATEGNANADEIKNNSPDSEIYKKGKKYLQGSLVKFGDKIYLAKRNVPRDVDLDNPYYWEIFIDAADSKRVDKIFEEIGTLDNLETESKDNLVAAVNEVNAVQANLEQNDEAARDYVKGRTHWAEKVITNVPVLTDAVLKYNGQGTWKYTGEAISLKSLNLQQDTTVYVKVFDTIFTKQLERMPDTPEEAELYQIKLDTNIVNGLIVPTIYEFSIREDKIFLFGMGSSTSDDISISISADVEKEVVHTIDPKYIKDMYYTECAVVKADVIANASIKYVSQGSWNINGGGLASYSSNIKLTEGTPITITIETENFTGQLNKSPANSDMLQFVISGNPKVNGYSIPSYYFFDPDKHNLSLFGGGTTNDPAMSFSITAKIEQEAVHTINPKYLPIFKAELEWVEDNDDPQLQLAGSVTVGDLIGAFDDGKKVIIHVPSDNTDYATGCEFELEKYHADSHSDIESSRLAFKPYSLVDCAATAAFADVILFNLLYDGTRWDIAQEFFYAEYYVGKVSFEDIRWHTQDFMVAAFILDKDDNKLYLQIPDCTNSASPSSLTFEGTARCVTNSNGNMVYLLGTYNHRVEFSVANGEIDWNNPVYDHYVRLDGPTVYNLTQYSGETQTAILCDTFGYPLSSYGQLRIDDQIEYNHHRYSYRTGQDSTNFGLCYDSIKYNKAVNGMDIASPQISTITVNRMRNTISVEDFKPMLPEATASEALTAVDDIFGAPV